MQSKNYKAQVRLNGILTTVKTRAGDAFEATRILDAQYGKVMFVQEDNDANQAEARAQKALWELEDKVQQAGRTQRETSEKSGPSLLGILLKSLGRGILAAIKNMGRQYGD